MRESAPQPASCVGRALSSNGGVLSAAGHHRGWVWTPAEWKPASMIFYGHVRVSTGDPDLSLREAAQRTASLQMIRDEGLRS